MKDKKFYLRFDFFVFQVGFIFFLFFDFIILYFDIKIGLICFLLIVLFVIYNLRFNRKKNK